MESHHIVILNFQISNNSLLTPLSNYAFESDSF